MTEAGSTWAPLRSPIYRALWIAQLVSNLGTWMQTVGAQWMLVGDPRAAVLVPLVQTATTLPVMLLALPSGVLADLVDRRRLLIATQAAMAAGVGVLSFSALCYGRLLRRPPQAPAALATPRAEECYRYSLAQPGVSACLSAPRRPRELRQVDARAEPDIAQREGVQAQEEDPEAGPARCGAEPFIQVPVADEVQRNREHR